MTFLLNALLLLIFSPCASASTDGEVTDFSKAKWEKHSDDDGVRVDIWEVPNSPTFAFRAEGEIEAPVGKVASVLIDLTRRKEWNSDVGEARTLRQISATERLDYWVIETPFVIKDRDFVLHTKAEFDVPNNTLFLKFHSTDDPAMPETSRVRGKIHNSYYSLTPSPDGKKTKVVFLVHVDPMGSCPKWIVNMFQKGYPHRNLTALRKQVMKPDIGEHAQVKALFETKQINRLIMGK